MRSVPIAAFPLEVAAETIGQTLDAEVVSQAHAGPDEL